MRIMTEAMLQACDVDLGSSVLVALSGGGDSVALCHSVWQLQKAGYLDGVFAAHVHHGIRGEGAERDADFCAAFCRTRDIPFFLERVDAPALARREGLSIELAARRLRYTALRRVRLQVGASCILTGHHRGDQAETLLLHLLRGCGTGGLGAMAKRSGDVARPLLSVSQEEIAAYLAREGLAYCVDETNAKTELTRNRVRHVLMPMLESFNPNVGAALAQTAELAAADDSFLTGLAEEALERARTAGGYDRALLAGEPMPIRSRAVRRLLLALSEDVTHADIRRVCALLDAQTGVCIELRAGARAWVDSSEVHLGAYPAPEHYETPFAADGVTCLPTGGRLIARYETALVKPKNGYEAYLDGDRLPADLVVRTRRDGDRFYPYGAPGERKLSDYLIDRKTPRERRDVALLASGRQIYCVFGHTVSELAAIRPDTKRILHIIYEHEGEKDE